jgi:hypothetical protein
VKSRIAIKTFLGWAGVMLSRRLAREGARNDRRRGPGADRARGRRGVTHTRRRHAIRRTTTEDPAPRYIYPAEDDPGALRVELSLQGVSARGVALDDPKFADERERERTVRTVTTSAQAADLVRRLQAVLAEITL